MAQESAIKYLNFLVKQYEGVTQLITQTKQRLQTLPGDECEEEFDTLLKGQEKEAGLETIKNRISRELSKELASFEDWVLWLEKVPGIGPWIGARLILFFHYRFTAICKDCGGALEKEEHTLVCQKCGVKAKEGLLKYRVDEKDFPTISKWWAYMGRHTVDGGMPKRKKGTRANWSAPGRTVGYHIGESFNRFEEDHPYKKLLLLRKAKHQRNRPEWSKGHVHNAAKNEVVKIFLAHYWTMARMIEGKEISEPYAAALMGHTNIIQPFYSEDVMEFCFEPVTD
jgi:hypothetical protein